MRKTRAKKRILTPDPKFNDVMVTRFVNGMMYDGKKSTSLNIFYLTFFIPLSISLKRKSRKKQELKHGEKP